MKKKKLKFGAKKVFYISADPYKQECIVVCNGDFNDAYDYIKTLKTPNAISLIKHINDKKDIYFKEKGANTMGFLFTELPCGYVMIIKHQESWINSVGTISHECLHLAHYILKRAGLELSQDSEEAFTYLQQDLLEKILHEVY